MVPRIVTLCLALLITSAAEARADGMSEFFACYEALNNGDNLGAIAACDRAVAAGGLTEDQLAVTFTRRSIADRNLRRYDAAVADCHKAIAHRADDQGAHVACGNAEGSKGAYQAALKSFSEAIEIDPNRADAYNNRGNIYNQLGDFAQAMTDFDTALQLAPNYVWAEINRGVALYGLSRYAEAAAAFDAANSSDPSNAYAVLWLALAQKHAGKDPHMTLVSAALTLDLDQWPGPIVKDYQLALAPMAPVVSTERPAVALEPTEQEKCETAFYDGELDLVKNNPDAAKPQLQQAADTCPKTYIEHAAALAELRQLMPGPE